MHNTRLGQATENVCKFQATPRDVSQVYRSHRLRTKLLSVTTNKHATQIQTHKQETKQWVFTKTTTTNTTITGGTTTTTYSRI